MSFINYFTFLFPLFLFQPNIYLDREIDKAEGVGPIFAINSGIVTIQIKTEAHPFL